MAQTKPPMQERLIDEQETRKDNLKRVEKEMRDAEMEEWSKSKNQAKSAVTEKLNVFNKKFDNPITISSPKEVLN